VIFGERITLLAKIPFKLSECFSSLTAYLSTVLLWDLGLELQCWELEMPVVGPIHYTNTGHIGIGICGTGIIFPVTSCHKFLS